jgi:hypothetical protein
VKKAEIVQSLDKIRINVERERRFARRLLRSTYVPNSTYQSTSWNEARRLDATLYPIERAIKKLLKESA